MSSSKVAVVIPHHKEELKDFEKISLAQVQKVLGRYPIIFAVPEGKNFSWIPKGSVVKHFPYLGFGVPYYDKLLQSSFFYEAFLEYDYILIYHLDAFVFSDKLEYFCSLGYDNIGAAWPYMFGVTVRKFVNDKKIILRSGNGGFCLRKVKSFLNVLYNHQDFVRKIYNYSDVEQKLEKGQFCPEDVFFAYCGSVDALNFKNAPIDIAYGFSAEFFPERCFTKNENNLPFGCHDFITYMCDFYVEQFLKLGYDFRAYNKQPDATQIFLQNWLSSIAYSRFFYRKINIQRFLTEKNYSVLAIDNPISLTVAKKIMEHKFFTADSVLVYPSTLSGLDYKNLLLSLADSEKNILFITTQLGDDKLFLEEMKKNNLQIGRNVVFFHSAYLNYCEKLFHNLGK